MIIEEPPAEVTNSDLTEEQRIWSPVNCAEAWDVWPCGWKLEMREQAPYGHGIHFTNGSGPDWDWRCVVMAARCYPGWRVVLTRPGLLSVYAPSA